MSAEMSDNYSAKKGLDSFLEGIEDTTVGQDKDQLSS